MNNAEIVKVIQHMLYTRDFDQKCTAALRHAIAGLTQETVPCKWTLDPYPDEEIWESECGQSWSFITDGPVENNVRFCHHCGRPVAIVHANPEK